jgi:hypothetical protein
MFPGREIRCVKAFEEEREVLREPRIVLDVAGYKEEYAVVHVVWLVNERKVYGNRKQNKPGDYRNIQPAYVSLNARISRL